MNIMRDINKVLFLFELSDEEKLVFKNILPSAEYIYSSHADVSKQLITEADVIFGNAPSSMVKDSINLKWLQLLSAGSDQFHVEGMFPKNAILTNATGGYGPAMSEYMIGMLLAIMKKLHIYRDNQKKCLWEKAGKLPLIEGSTSLIIGLGDIGGEFSRKIKYLGSHTIGVRRTNINKPDYVDEQFASEDIDQLLPRADIVALALPATDDTKHILSAKRISMLKKNAIIINVGRGTSIDTEALCEALYNGEIGGAALDVTDPEPLPPGHRLWNAPNTLITPHASGNYDNKRSHPLILDICIHNFKAFVDGEKMRNVVDFSRGY